MTYGYSMKLAHLNELADANELGVRLGRVCIARGIPVMEVASRLKVRRQTVYNWFIGFNRPSAKYVDLINEYLVELG